MSAQVFNPLMLCEFTKIRSPGSLRKPLPSAGVAVKVKRDLFGPVDKEDSERFLEREFAIQNEKYCKKWGFNFALGEPIQNHEQYAWERVPVPTVRSTSIPGMITLTTAAHAVSRPSAAEELLDRRAERENRTISTADDNAETTNTDILDQQKLAIDRWVSGLSKISSNSASDSESVIRTHPITNNNVEHKSFHTNLSRTKRQQRITDYLKEKKRRSPTSPKHTPAKKSRTSLTSSGLARQSSS